MNGKYKTGQQGFVALISVIIIFIVLLIISSSISLTSFLSRFNVSDAEYKKRSSALAEACVDKALLQLAQNPANTTGSSTVAVSSSDNCSFGNIGQSGGKYTIKTQAFFPSTGVLKSYTNILVTASTTSLSIISWSETAN